MKLLLSDIWQFFFWLNEFLVSSSAPLEAKHLKFDYQTL